MARDELFPPGPGKTGRHVGVDLESEGVTKVLGSDFRNDVAGITKSQSESS